MRRNYGGNWEYIANQLAMVYTTNTSALKEIYSNSIDALVQKNDGLQRIVTIIQKKDLSLTVIDNGIGMNYNEINEIPGSIGISGKIGMEGMIGCKHMGFLAFLKYSEKSQIFSRVRENDKVNFLELYAKRGEVESYNIPQLEKMGIPDYIIRFLSESYGTVNHVTGIHPRAMKDFGLQKIIDFLSKTYTPMLETGKVEMVVTDGKSDPRIVEPHQFQELEKISDDTIDVSFMEILSNEPTKGQVHAKLYIGQQPKGENHVAVYNRNVLVCNDITNLQYMEKKMPWSFGVLTGYINENFCDLSPSKEFYQDNNALNTFLNQVHEIGALVAPQLDLSFDIGPQEKIRSKILDAFTEAYGSLNLKQYFVNSRLPRIETGLNATDKIRSKDITDIIQDTHTENVQSPQVENIQNIHNEDIPAPAHSRLTHRKARSPFILNFTEFSMPEARYRSKLINNVLLEINSSHEDYIRASRSDRKLIEYVIRQLALQTALSVYNHWLSEGRELDNARLQAKMLCIAGDLESRALNSL